MPVKHHRVPMGGQVLCTEVYRCQACPHQTGTVRVQSHGATSNAAAR